MNYDEMMKKAENRFIPTKNGFEKYVDLPENKVLRASLSFWGNNKIPSLCIVSGKREEIDRNLCTMDLTRSLLIPLGESFKRKNFNFLVKLTHDFPDEKIINSWKEYVSVIPF